MIKWLGLLGFFFPYETLFWHIYNALQASAQNSKL